MRTITAPDRTVCQYRGEVTDAPVAIPAVLPDEQIATLTRERDDARAELDNMVNLAIEVGRLGNYLKHAIADRDEYRDRADDWRDRYESAQCRMDEMAEEIRELKRAASQ